MKKLINRWLPVVLWFGVIFFFSSRADLPKDRIDWVDFIIKKSAHMTEFAILALLAFRAFGRPRPDYAFLLALLVAFSDETHQWFTPGRGASLRDVGIDSIGITLASLWLLKYYPRWQNIHSKPILKKKPKK